MKILIFNWRDIKNPDAGGAEVYTHEISKRLVIRGNNVTILTSAFDKCRREEEIDGVRVIRCGGKYLVYLRTKEYYKRYLERENYDIVVDEINTIPFFTINFIKNRKNICLIYQLAREFWFYETKFPINYLGYYWLENKWLKSYINVPTITISQSTKKGLKEIGFKKIFIIPIGISKKPLNSTKKKGKDTTLLYIGRLTRAKKPYDIIKAFKIVSEKYANVRLLIIGDGYLKKDLIRFSELIGCNSNVIFLGHLSEEEKYEKIKKSDLLLVSGVREGWGMVVTEANSIGIPAIGYNIPGLRDSIIDGKTGFLSNPSPDDMAKKIIKFLKNKALQNSLSVNALEYSKKFLWKKSAVKFEKTLLKVCNA